MKSIYASEPCAHQTYKKQKFGVRLRSCPWSGCLERIGSKRVPILMTPTDSLRRFVLVRKRPKSVLNFVTGGSQLLSKIRLRDSRSPVVPRGGDANAAPVTLADGDQSTWKGLRRNQRYATGPQASYASSRNQPPCFPSHAPPARGPNAPANLVLQRPANSRRTRRGFTQDSVTVEASLGRALEPPCRRRHKTCSRRLPKRYSTSAWHTVYSQLR